VLGILKGQVLDYCEVGHYEGKYGVTCFAGEGYMDELALVIAVFGQWGMSSSLASLPACGSPYMPFLISALKWLYRRHLGLTTEQTRVTTDRNRSKELVPDKNE
jgi:hypothetical protein